MSKGAEAKGVYGLWMVVKRKFNGHKVTKHSYGTESVVIPVWNSSPQPIPKILEWMGTSPSGPVLDQSIPHKGAKHRYGHHSRKGDVDWLPKAPSLCTLPMDCEGIFNIGPSKSIVINNRSNGEDVGQKLRPKPGPIAHLHKRLPPSVKGKKNPC